MAEVGVPIIAPGTAVPIISPVGVLIIVSGVAPSIIPEGVDIISPVGVLIVVSGVAVVITAVEFSIMVVPVGWGIISVAAPLLPLAEQAGNKTAIAMMTTTRRPACCTALT